MTCPPIPDTHLRAAFDTLRMPGWTYEAARADALRSRVIEALAQQRIARQARTQRVRVIHEQSRAASRAE